MTKEELAEIREAEQAATDGPWKARQTFVSSDIYDVAETQDPLDARFIALCRSAVPALLEHVEDLARERDMLKQDCADWREEYERACVERAEVYESARQIACGFAFDHGRVLEEAAGLWDEVHEWQSDRGAERCACEREPGPCPTNPYRSAT